MLAIIGGSGLYNFNSIEIIEKINIETPFGSPSAAISRAKIDESEFFFLPRHGDSHQINPSEINYRANIYALKKIGITHIISISAVGSLKEEHKPGYFVLPDQFIDWTKGIRKRTFFENGIVGHVSVANPIEINLQREIVKVLESTKIIFSIGGSYLCIEGPQFSSKAESNIYRSFGADIIGMTNVPECYLAKEAGIAYATIAMVTDYDCWKEEHCTLEEILTVMKSNTKKAHAFVESFVKHFGKKPIRFENENSNCIVTNKEVISQENQKILDILLK